MIPSFFAEETLISIRTVKALAWERLSYERLMEAGRDEVSDPRRPTFRARHGMASSKTPGPLSRLGFEGETV